MAAGFHKLRVYQLAEQLADEIWRVVAKWPALARNTVGVQIIDSSDSVGANIAEGVGRGTYKDNCRFIMIARGSLNETGHWLRRAYRRDLLKPQEVDRFGALISELGPRLNSYLNSVRTRCTAARTNSRGDKSR